MQSSNLWATVSPDRGNVLCVYSQSRLRPSPAIFVCFKSESELLCLLWLNTVKISAGTSGTRITWSASYRPSIESTQLDCTQLNSTQLSSPVIKIATCCLLLLLLLRSCSCCCHIYCTPLDLLLAFIKSAQQLQFNIKNNNKQQQPRQPPAFCTARVAFLQLIIWMGNRDQKTRGWPEKSKGVQGCWGQVALCSSIENVLMHASPVNACQLLLHCRCCICVWSCSNFLFLRGSFCKCKQIN